MYFEMLHCMRDDTTKCWFVHERVFKIKCSWRFIQKYFSDAGQKQKQKAKQTINKTQTFQKYQQQKLKNHKYQNFQKIQKISTFPNISNFQKYQHFQKT